MSSTAFKKELYQSINEYFDKNEISRYANGQMKAKLIIAVVWWVGSLVLLYTASTSSTHFVLIYGLHLFSHLFILLNIAHDANHFAIINEGMFKKTLRYSFDICGINSYMWRQLHNLQHHNYMNVKGEDDGLEARGLLRYTKYDKRKFIHRFQHFYTFIVYCFFSLDYIFVKDFECFFFPFLNGLKGKKHPRIEYIKLFFFKLVYVGYVIVLPIYFLEFSIGLVILAFCFWHFLVGLIGAIIIQVEHPLRANEFPESQDDYEHFVYHVFATTSDHSVNGFISKWFYGGLHLHVAHHLAPRVCHTHYQALTARIKPIAEKYGITYKVNKNIFYAIKEHYLHLKNLGLNTE